MAILLVIASILVVFLAPLWDFATRAEADGGWSIPVLLSDSRAVLKNPIVVADRYGEAQVLWSELGFADDSPNHNKQLVFYARWDGKAFTKPVDIIASSSLNPASAAIDWDSRVHLLWFGTLSALRYTRAEKGGALSARSWTEPALVAQTNPHAVIATGPDGRLHRAYPGSGSLGLYYQASSDGGFSWSFPVRVAATASEKSSADWVRMAIGNDETIHIVWTEWRLPTGWPPLGVYYSNSRDNGRHWSTPIALAGSDYDQINVAAGPDNVVHVAWNGMVGVPGGRYHRWSADGGITWSPTITLTTKSGTEGPPQLAVDSTGTLHLVTTLLGRVWYGSWRLERGWSSLEYVPSGDESGIPPLTTADVAKIREIEQVSMAFGGNKLHVVFWEKRMPQEYYRLWYTMKEISAASISPAPLSTTVPVSMTGIARPTPLATSVPTGSQANMKTNESITAEVPSNPQSAALIALWPAIVLIGVVVLARVTNINTR